MKYLLRHAKNDEGGTVIDGDSLHRWIATVRAADAGDSDAAQILPRQSIYIAERMADLLDYAPEDDDEPLPRDLTIRFGQVPPIVS